MKWRQVSCAQNTSRFFFPVISFPSSYFPLTLCHMVGTLVSTLGWDTYYRLLSLRTTIPYPQCSGKIMNFGWVPGFVCSPLLSLYPKSISWTLFVCPPRTDLPQSLTNPSFSASPLSQPVYKKKTKQTNQPPLPHKKSNMDPGVRIHKEGLPAIVSQVSE